eukprot:6203271-Pleurochrysis_carterae.AAC.4
MKGAESHGGGEDERRDAGVGAEREGVAESRNRGKRVRRGACRKRARTAGGEGEKRRRKGPTGKK